MRIIQQPEIYVVGRQTLDNAEVQRFLADHETEWQTDSENGSELIVELAGRTCFDSETEILTNKGWKLFADLDQSEEVLTLNPQTKYVEFQRPMAYQAYHYAGPLRCIEGRDVSFAVTPDHRQFGHYRGETMDSFVQTDEIRRRIFKIKAAGIGWEGYYPDAIVMDGVEVTQRVANQFGSYGSVAIAARPRVISDQVLIRTLALLLTYYVTEGTLQRSRNSGQGIVIYGDHEAAIRELCCQLDYPVSTYVDPRNHVARMAVGGGATLRAYCEDQCGSGSQNKRLPQWALNLPEDALAMIWDTLVVTDGHRYERSNREVLITTSPVLAGQAQEILCKLGFGATILYESAGVNYPVYRVSRKSGRDIVLNQNALIEERYYEGNVYCVSTKNGVIYVRRHGKSHFSGNCYMSFGSNQFRKTNADYVGNLINQGHGSVLEHAVWDLLLTGVSRSLTHELVRHRAGTGFCLTGDTLIYSDHRWGKRLSGITKRSLKSLYEMNLTPHGRSRIKLLRLRCLDEAKGLFTSGKVNKIICSGAKPVFQVELQDGKVITCTKEHRFLTKGGWASLEEAVGGLTITEHGFAVYGKNDAEIMVNGVPAYKDRDWLHEQYVVNNLEQEAIAELAGVSHHTIRAWVRKHSLQKPLGSWTKGRAPWNKAKRYRAGWSHSAENKEVFRRQKIGANNPQWRGGITPRAIVIRRGMKELRPQVFARDNYQCRLCGKVSKQLDAHHVLPIWTRPDLALDTNNLVTLCRPCHKQRVNTHEEDYVERFGCERASLREQPRPVARPKRVTTHPVRIVSVTYAGEQMTYDIEMEEPHHNFVANGIVTHNSQLSQRYVDESTADFVEPAVIAADPEMHATWLSAIEAAHAAYNTLVEQLAERVQAEHADLPRTQRKKMAREAARSVLPNATETKLLFSANARALRWIITLRGGEGAEPEIRRLAVALARLMREEAPNLFGDIEIVTLPDGTEGTRVVHQKV